MITILLSTYNGARFLPEQLASFERQTDPDWRLVWRDDGSTDDTVAIMEEFNARVKRCTQITYPNARLGPTNSFLLLLRTAGQSLGREDIVVFADQDDVWIPKKLERARKYLTNIFDCVPTLYFARQKFIDQHNNLIGESAKLKSLPSFPNCLAQNVAAGCTIALNYEATRLVNTIRPPSETFHDWWCYIVISACGGRCIYDEDTVILYRQHSDNATGAQTNYIRRAIGAWRRGPSRFMMIFRAHIDALAHSPSMLATSHIKIVEEVRRGFYRQHKGFFTILKNKIHRQTILETAAFYMWIILG